MLLVVVSSLVGVVRVKVLVVSPKSIFFLFG